MKCREVKYYMGDYLKGKLIDEMRREIAVHISFCSSCKTKLEQLKTASKSSREKFAGDFWEGSSDLNEYDSDLKLPDILFSKYRGKDDPVYKLKPRNWLLHSKWIAVGMSVVSIILAILITIMYFSRTTTAFWQVETLRGNPIAGDQPLNGREVLPNGKWLKTDASSEAELKSAIIGDIHVAPESQVKLVAVNKKEYRLFLKSGKISAKTWSPPDFFKIEIPAGEVIDLGCAFTLEAGNDKSSVLEVSSGWTVLKTGEEKFVVPAGMVCATDKNGNTGIPYHMNASSEFKDALLMYDQGNDGNDVIQNILSHAKKSDEVSLWYLLKEAKPDNKKMIYDRLAEFARPPENVNYKGIMNNNEEMLLCWWEKLDCGSRTLWSYMK
ncbi:MAG TPA: hypothetical protein VLB50_09350 [Ignavibacteriaceae bacterium]|nr:hypothetical protein [Ignavibacteriaceae bacterium]